MGDKDAGTTASAEGVREILVEPGQELPPVKTDARTRFVLRELRPPVEEERQRLRDEAIAWLSKP